MAQIAFSEGAPSLWKVKIRLQKGGNASFQEAWLTAWKPRRHKLSMTAARRKSQRSEYDN